jgi:cysteinyl-tRNA synthetase
MAPALDALVKFRDEIRALAKGAAVDKGALMRACDALRDEGLPAIGVKLDDRDGGALWKMSSPEELQKELAREAEAKAKKELETRRKKEEAAKKAAEKEAAARVDPREMFTLGEYAGVYAEYDEEGIPTKTKDGEEVAKAQRKKLAKAHGAQKTAHEKYLAKQAADGVADVKL